MNCLAGPSRSSVFRHNPIGPQIQIKAPAISIRNFSSPSSTRIRHGSTNHPFNNREIARQSLKSQHYRTIGIRSFSILPASLNPELPQVTEEILNNVSTTDEQLTSVSTFFDFIVHPLSDQLISIPHPFGYGTSIIILTLIIRSIFTLPISLWQRKRSLRFKNFVQPELKIINEKLAKSIMIESKKRNLGYEEYTLELRRQVEKAQKNLNKKYKTNPIITTYSPLFVHIPIFVTLSLTIRRTLEISNSPFFNENFLWLEKLGEIDPYCILPLIGSCLAFGNAELIGRKPKSIKQINEVSIENDLNSPQSQIQSRSSTPPPPRTTEEIPKPSPLFSNKPNSSLSVKSNNSRRKLNTSSIKFGVLQQIQREKRKDTDPLVEVKKNPNQRWSPARQQEIRRGFMASVLRFSAVGFGLIASQMPAGVTLYWVTSIGFSFVQNLILSWYPQVKAERESAKKLAALDTKSTI
ncbi:uncharacterized protein I206_100363 [Kwoniella pini CBS 10737]|uniref:Membrane insertase YidC/Oxa/ALB C-terminal domain-containing protein n=1 Tax=Kwoniella pini CBS 10737 TaxID=1296096 RepID=A0A1B9IDN0_9TREE|nr:uncharacterized protein I206_00962 [Kwoniella pini CBS 10737]OCF53656.1 hypothetical protein I206_00962 [Kwoniella pini CBS 10737]